ncbi:MAG: hypothetical protein Q9187_006303 [Circinaria calcarea]
MSYNDWLADAGMRMPELVSAMEKINGPFLPNTFTGRMEDIWNIAVDDEEDANSGQGAGSLSDSRVQTPSNDAGSISLGGSGDITEFMGSESLEEQREDVDSHRETAHSEDSSGPAAVPRVDSLCSLGRSDQPIIEAEEDRNNSEARNDFENSNNTQDKWPWPWLSWNFDNLVLQPAKDISPSVNYANTLSVIQSAYRSFSFRKVLSRVQIDPGLLCDKMARAAPVNQAALLNDSHVFHVNVQPSPLRGSYQIKRKSVPTMITREVYQTLDTEETLNKYKEKDIEKDWPTAP